ncbi:MAG: flagellar motor switch protein FliG [Rhodobacteraceae bacterium]|nr:flagellar motor switch protein FliG [Paracoccaceae bacterium]
MQQETALALPNAAQTSRGVSEIERPKLDLSKLKGRAKAAIVVRLLLNEGADIPLEELPDDLQAALTQQMGNMGIVDRDTLYGVVQEFAEMLDGVGLSFPKGIGGALSVLDGKISPQTAARLRKEAGVRMAGDPWERLRALPAEDLVDLVTAESTEIAAVILSKLDVPKAAELLGKLPGPDARRITFAVSQTGNVTPETVDRIGLSLATQLEDKPMTAFEDAPGERVGAILNLSPASRREEMLTALDETDEDFATAVRKSIFTFAHIPDRLSPRDVPQVLRETDQEVLVSALAFATEDENQRSAEFLLSNISSRLADNLREEVSERGKVKPVDGEAAMNAVIGAIRALEQAGTIELAIEEEDEESN